MFLKLSKLSSVGVLEGGGGGGGGGGGEQQASCLVSCGISTWRGGGGATGFLFSKLWNFHRYWLLFSQWHTKAKIIQH